MQIRTQVLINPNLSHTINIRTGIITTMIKTILLIILLTLALNTTLHIKIQPLITSTQISITLQIILRTTLATTFTIIPHTTSKLDLISRTKSHLLGQFNKTPEHTKQVLREIDSQDTSHNHNLTLRDSKQRSANNTPIQGKTQTTSRGTALKYLLSTVILKNSLNTSNHNLTCLPQFMKHRNLQLITESRRTFRRQTTTRISLRLTC